MPDVPYPITAENSEDLKRQVYELIREIIEERIGGLTLGDVFSNEGDVLTLRLGTNPCLQKVANQLQLEVKTGGGLQATSTGVAAKLKTGGGLDVDTGGLFVSSSAYGFGTVNCPAGTDPIADQTNDTLNLTAGNGLTITGDSATDTIAFAVKQQAHETDASTSHAITDPADSPASADALRDDLVTNTIPAIESALNALGTKINAILSKLESADILASS